MNNYHNQIKKFYRLNKRMPSYREIMALTGLKSLNSVAKLIKKMVALDMVNKDSQGKIIPGQCFYQIPLLGVVQAGFPSPAEEELIDTLTLDDFLIRNKEATYILKVTGDSMIEAGIMPGELALVERGTQAKDGDIVIAKIDDQWTMKYFCLKGSKIFLKPANKKYQPIYPQAELEITAIVKAIIRKY